MAKDAECILANYIFWLASNKCNIFSGEPWFDNYT